MHTSPFAGVPRNARQESTVASARGHRIECLIERASLTDWRTVAVKPGDLDGAIGHAFDAYSAPVRIISDGRVVFERTADKPELFSHWGGSRG